MIQALNNKWVSQSAVLAIGAASLLFAGTTGAGLVKSDREVEGLKGAVHKVIEEWDSNRFMANYYDRTGNLTKFEMGHRGSGKVKTERRQTIFERDAGGQKTVSRSIGADGLPLDEIRYSYDERGNLVEQGTYRNNKLLFKSVHAYDDQGHKLETKTYLSDGSLKSKSVYTYDSKGNIATIASYKNCTSDQACALDYKAVDAYDGQGRMTEAVIYKANGTLDERRVYTYNANGYEQEVVVYSSAGIILKKETSSYEYDSNGNWTKRATIESTAKEGKFISEPPHITKRAITYYK